MKAQAARPAMQAASLPALQRSGALRPKLAVAPVDDPYEREADTVAAAIMAGRSAGPVAIVAAGVVQRQPVTTPGSPPPPVQEPLRPLVTNYEIDTKTDGQKLGKGAGEVAGQVLDTAPGKALQDAGSAQLERDWQRASTEERALMVVAAVQALAVVGGLKVIPEADEGPPSPEKTPRIKISRDFRVQLEFKVGWKDKAADGTEVQRRTPRVDSITVSLIWAPEGPKVPPDSEVVAAEIARVEASLQPFRPKAKGDGFAVDYAVRRMIEERRRRPSWLPPEDSQRWGDQAGRFRLDAGPFGARPRPGLRLMRPLELGQLAPSVTVQRKCAACAAEDDQTVQRKAAGSPAAPADAAVEGLGCGAPLPAAERAFFEPRLGRDLGDVRVHAETPAATSLGARAFALGREVAFAPGEWRPGTATGRGLLAHELVHVLQQDRGAPLAIRRDGGQGTTVFRDNVTGLSYPNAGPATGPISGTVTRTETAPASGGSPPQVVHSGRMHVAFDPDPSRCAVTVPFAYHFVQAPTAPGGVGICDDPPAATPVPTLSALSFNRLKASVLGQVASGLNGQFDVQLSGTGCPTGCTGRALPIRIDLSEDPAHPDTKVTVVNRGGRADAATICARSWDSETAIHEGGHQVLGIGDEYPEQDARVLAAVPEWGRAERVRRDWSRMGPEDHSRFAMFHERHFNAVKVFLENAYPDCTATLIARPRLFRPDFRVSMGGGWASLSGKPGFFFQAGLGMGLPLDRLRRWNVVLGPQLRLMNGSDDQGSLRAFMLGARFALEGSTGHAGHGFIGGAFGEAGWGSLTSSDYRPGGAGSRSWSGGYGEVGLGLGYRTSRLDGPRFDFRLEGAAGSTLDSSGRIGPDPPFAATDPARAHWFRLGIQAVMAW